MIRSIAKFCRWEYARHTYTGVLPLALVAAVILSLAMTVVGVNSIETQRASTPDLQGIVVKSAASVPDNVRVQRDTRSALSGWTLIAVVAFAFGAAVTASESSAGTLRRSLLLHPDRRTYALGKVGAAAALSTAAGAVLGYGNWALGSVLLNGRGIERTSGLPEELLIVAAGAVSVGAFAVIGAAFGLLARSAYALIAFGVIILLVGESVLLAKVPSVADLMPGHLLERVSRSGANVWEMSSLSGPAAVLALCVWAVATTAFCATVFARSDVR